MSLPQNPVQEAGLVRSLQAYPVVPIGMVLAFHQLATSSGQAEMGSLAEGIYTAMTTTVAGLIVGIIAYMGYNHLVVRTDKVVHQMEATAVDFLDLLNEPA